MRSPNDCWIDLHRLASSLDASGLTRQDRFDTVVEELLALPPLVRRELLRDLRMLLADLTDLEPIVVNAINAAEGTKAKDAHTA